MTSFLLWGAGGHGKVVADLVRAAGHAVAGFIDADPGLLGLRVESGGGRVVVIEGELLERLRGGGPLPAGCDAVALAIGDNRRRLDRFHLLAACELPPLVHPSAVVSPSARIGRGSVVFAGAVIHADARVGEAVIVNTGAVVEHDCEVGDGAHLSPRAVLAGGVRVGRRSWVGAGAVVIQGLSIGDDTRIGAGAAVVRDVGDGLTVAGVPAKVLPPTGTMK